MAYGRNPICHTFIFFYEVIILTNKQNALLILMDAIDCKDQNIAILCKYKDKNVNTIEIEPIENVSNIIKDINDNYDDNLVNENKKTEQAQLVPIWSC